MTTADWQERISKAIQVHKSTWLRIADPKKQARFTPTAPNPPASEAEIAAVEEKIGEALPSEYRNFLLSANGWISFCGAYTLFSCFELIQGKLRNQADEVKREINEIIEEQFEISADNTFPILNAEASVAIALICLRNSNRAGAIIWFGGSDIELYDNFISFFDASLNIYNQIDLNLIT